jgi:predicted AlkP superfamily pyrophosphatase or phosphodiesterase
VGNSVVVESDILKNSTFHKDAGSSFELINSMLVSQETRNDNELIQAMDTYLYNSHFFEANLVLL